MTTDWKEVVLQAREAELGVTGEGIIVLNACATQFGYTANNLGVIDPETDKVITDPSILAPIYQRGRMQMRVTSQTGKELLEKV